MSTSIRSHPASGRGGVWKNMKKLEWELPIATSGGVTRNLTEIEASQGVLERRTSCKQLWLTRTEGITLSAQPRMSIDEHSVVVVEIKFRL